MTLKERLAQKDQFVESEQIQYIEALERVLETSAYKRLLSVTNFSDDDRKELKEAIRVTIRKAPFEEQSEYLKPINDFFAEDSEYCCGSRICDISKIFDSLEIEIFLLRYLQGGEDPTEARRRRREDIAEKFGISSTTLDSYLNALQNGKDILGSHVQIELRRRENNYDSTIHPVFLALNLSEIYMLTVSLKKAFGDNAAELVADIYRQLSPYAREKIDFFADRDQVEPFTGKNNSAIPQGYRREGKDALYYYLKSGALCEIGFVDEIPKRRTGKIKCGDETDLVFVDQSGERIPLDRESSRIDLLKKIK